MCHVDGMVVPVHCSLATAQSTCAAQACSLCSDNDGLLGAEGQLSIARVDADDVALVELALQQRQRDRIADLPLEHPLERAGAEVGVVARVRDMGPGRLRELEPEV